MNGLLVTRTVVLALATAVGGEVQQPPPDLPGLVTSLRLTGQGVETWLHQFEPTADGEPTERLVVVTVTGEPLLEREGERSFVRVDPELDTKLRQPGTAVALVHNHPNNLGLSEADLAQLVKPGVAVVVAIGHDRSVFVAAAGPSLDRDFFESRQYALARTEVLKRIRAECSSGIIPVVASDAHFSHLVTLALARADIVQYWYRLRGQGSESYSEAQVSFGRVVAGAANRLKKTR